MRKTVLLYAAISLILTLRCLAQEPQTEKTNIPINRTRKLDQLFDVTAYGARAVSLIPTTTVAVTNGSTKAILESISSFQNGDGVTVYGAGESNNLSTPGVPVVTPSIASGGTTTGIVTNSPRGKSTYSYKIVARDKFGALTAAGLPTTINSGQNSLGLQTFTITTATRSNDSVTVNTSDATALVAGVLVHITGSSNPSFDGWFIVNAVNSGTQFLITDTSIDSRGIGWQFGDSPSSSGGTVAFYLSNHITWKPVIGAWEYYIYGKRLNDTSYNLIGQTKPSANTWIDVEFDDYGKTYMQNQTFPNYVPLTAPLSATNDPLTTTIVSGAGTKSIILAKEAMQTVSGLKIIFDDGPSIAAATIAATGIGPVYFPPTLAGNGYIINSYTLLPANTTIFQAGYIVLNETVQLQSSTSWTGNWSNTGEPQFGFTGSALISVSTANPGIYSSASGVNTSYLSFQSTGTNGGVLWLSQDAVNQEFDYDSFVANSVNNSDYLSTPLVFRSTSTGGNNYHFRKTLFSAGPNQIADKSWTPLVYFPPNQNGSGGLLLNQNNFFRCMECFFNRRGIEQEQTAGSAGKWEFDGGYRQGGITPLFAEGNNNGNAAGTIIFNNMVQDTEAVGSVAIWGVNGTNGISIQSNFLSNSSADINGVPPPFSGQRAAAVTEFGSYMGNAPNRGSEVTSNPTCVVTYPYAITGTNSCISDAMHKFFETVDFPSRNSIFWDLPVPTAVTVDNATAGGSLTANTTYYYTVSATGVDGGETVPATVAASSNTTSLNRTFDVSWTGITGAESYNVYRCSLHCVFTDGRIQNSGNWRLIKRLVLTTKIIDNGLGVGQGPPTVTGTGTVGVNATEVYAPAFVTVSPLSNGKSYIATDTAPVTADRSYTKPDQSGTYALDLTGMISVINGKVLDSSCISGTARVEKAMVGMPVIVSTADGSDLGGRFNVRGSVSKNNIVTVYICGTGTPPSKAYNVRVIQ